MVNTIFKVLLNFGLLKRNGNAKGPNMKNRSMITGTGRKYHLTFSSGLFIFVLQNNEADAPQPK